MTTFSSPLARPLPQAPIRPRVARSTRSIAGTAFAGVLLALLLPFGSVYSCDTGEEVRFTGIQLATAQVPPDPANAGDLNSKVERDATLLALSVLVAAVVGIGLALVGRPGGGYCAAAGLLSLQVFLWVGLVAWEGTFDVYEGFGLAFASFALAGVVHLAANMRIRRRAGARAWTYVLRTVVLTFLPTIVFAGLLLVAGLS
jgi:hypothetical protein